MIHEILEDELFAQIMRSHAHECVKYLLNKNIHFSMAARLDMIEFNPKLPEEIFSNFSKIIAFSLAGYTYESTKLEEDSIVFEAGFGDDNIGAIVTIPLNAILQLTVKETPIFVNISTTTKKSIKKETKKTIEKKLGVKKSMEALMSNPENKHLLKKKN